MKLERKDRSPTCTLNEKIRQVHARIGNPANILLSLLILTYMGHGLIDRATQKLKMMSAGEQSIQWQYLESQYFADNFRAYNVDVLAILDCCFAAATRSLTDRTCQVLAVCGSNETETARSRVEASPFPKDSLRQQGSCGEFLQSPLLRSMTFTINSNGISLAYTGASA
jgi:hypothetical protein